MNTTVDVYRMNPEADTIVFGDELAEGMWVIYESPPARLRQQRTRRGAATRPAVPPRDPAAHRRRFCGLRRRIHRLRRRVG